MKKRAEREMHVRCTSDRSEPDRTPESSNEISISNLQLNSDAIAVASDSGILSTRAMDSTNAIKASIAAGCRIGSGVSCLRDVESAFHPQCSGQCSREGDEWTDRLGLTPRLV